MSEQLPGIARACAVTEDALPGPGEPPFRLVHTERGDSLLYRGDVQIPHSGETKSLPFRLDASELLFKPIRRLMEMWEEERNNAEALRMRLKQLEMVPVEDQPLMSKPPQRKPKL